MAGTFALPIDEPPSNPALDLILSNEATLTASLSMTLEQSTRGKSEDRPPPLSAEPGPQIDYRLLHAVIDKTRELLKPEDLEAFSKLADVRKKYWMALSGYAQIHRQVQDIWIQRQKLVDQTESVKVAAARWLSTLTAQMQSPRFAGMRPDDLRNAYKAKVQAVLRQNANSQALNAKESREAIERYYMFAKGLTVLSAKFIETKVDAMQSIYNAQTVLLAFWGDELAAAAEGGREPDYGDSTAYEVPAHCYEFGDLNNPNSNGTSYDMADNGNYAQQTIQDLKRRHGVEAASMPVYENTTAHGRYPHFEGSGAAAGTKAAKHEPSVSVVDTAPTSTKTSGRQVNCKKRGSDLVENEDGQQTMPELKRHHGAEASGNENWWEELHPLSDTLETDYWE
ncbi:hypothetical protein PVAR5_1366 [Paecilomyces variotii No. 5]|uniref:Uncharacterized protein n=1 Tax=Byssochlamys spectabilis (strain No. 5 / NBRC 109023) TaxID=1356009 RepID=V5HTC9_BYSSN|nr:hypothetical protein PVAR5_1366 [Paecilomyces variotii No. 5]